MADCLISRNVVGSQWNFQKIVNVFGPTFFLLSWMTGQFFRIKKQTKVEESLGTLESRFKELLDKVETKTEEMIGHVTGGNSFPWFQVAMIDNIKDKGVLMAIHHGVHPLYDVTARIVDLQKFQKVKNNISLATFGFTDTNVNVGNMIPSHASMIQEWKLEHIPEQSYNVFFTARNGSFTQLIRLKKVNSAWTTATRILKNNNLLYEQIDEKFPKNNGEILWN
jgi:hypothetical protein